MTRPKPKDSGDKPKPAATRGVSQSPAGPGKSQEKTQTNAAAMSPPPAPPAAADATKDSPKPPANQAVLLFVIMHGFSFARHACTCGAFVTISWFGFLSVKELAGKETSLNSFVQWAANLHISEGIAWLVALIFGGSFAVRGRTIKRLRKENLPRMARLEAMHDPHRTSSGLEDDGASPAGDAP
jgi:hypothetical protein